MKDTAEEFARTELSRIGRRLTKFERDENGDWTLHSIQDRWQLKHAQAEAERIRAVFEPHTERVEIAGSIRRQKPYVKDIELVCVPKFAAAGKDLFGKVVKWVDETEECVARLVKNGTLAFREIDGKPRNGPKYKALEIAESKMAIDLFIVRAPATWGVIFLLRTGSGDFNKRLINVLDRRGLSMANGRILNAGIAMPTPEEEDVFRVIRAKWKDPVERN